MDVPSLLLNSAKILGCRLDRASMTNVPCTDDARSRPLRQLRCHHLLWQRQPSDTTPRLDHAFSAGTKICRASSSRVPTSISRQSLLKSISPKRLLSIVLMASFWPLVGRNPSSERTIATSASLTPSAFKSKENPWFCYVTFTDSIRLCIPRTAHLPLSHGTIEAQSR